MTTKRSTQSCKTCQVFSRRKVTRGEYNKLKKRIAAKRATRSAYFPYEPPPPMPEYGDPCCYEIYWANYEWVVMATTVSDALAIYEGFRLTAEACIAAHQV